MNNKTHIILLIASGILFIIGLWPIGIFLFPIAIILLITDKLKSEAKNKSKDYDPEIK